jgi:hypothetical protein
VWKAFPKDEKMSAFAVVLVAGMAVGSGPAKLSLEAEQWLDLSGRWEGIWEDATGASFLIMSCGRELGGRPRLGPASILDTASVVNCGAGRFTAAVSDRACLGIYQWDGGQLFICLRARGQGWPASFRGGNGQHLLRLRRARPEN